MTNQRWTEVTEREYLRHELDALFAAVDRGDDHDAAVTAQTMREVLAGYVRAHGSGEIMARIATSNGRYLLPNRDACQDHPPAAVDG